MAALVRKTAPQFRRKNIFVKEPIYNKIASNIDFFTRNKATQKPIGQRIVSVAESLASKGFLRSIKPYSPPNNVSEEVKAICSSLNITVKSEKHTFSSMEEKFAVLFKCFDKFHHGVNNSQMYEMETIGDVINYYCTPVTTATPYDSLTRMELPENVHIQKDYVRFNPETDTMFGGKSAFPKSSTLVTGLKYRKKYAGHTAKTSWP